MEHLANKAREFAIEAHKGQTYGRFPYFTHLDQVAYLLKSFGHIDSLAVGFLHDVLEDTETTYEQLEQEFGKDIAKAVQFCSDEPGSSRKERKVLTYQKWDKLASEGSEWLPMAIQAKVADRLCNVSMSKVNNPKFLKMYKDEYPAFKAALYTPDICENMWIQLDLILT